MQRHTEDSITQESELVESTHSADAYSDHCRLTLSFAAANARTRDLGSSKVMTALAERVTLKTRPDIR